MTATSWLPWLRLQRRRGRPPSRVAFERRTAFCDCSPADGDLPVGPDGICASCHRPPRGHGPARAW